jgi:predicted MPP superfamily phosphohydrolase
LENDAVVLRGGEATPFWIAGLGDQRALYLGKGRYKGRDDLDRMLAQIAQSDLPIILLAHEPDKFPQVPHRVSLTVCGHTHGGQCRFPLIGAPIVPSYFGQRYVYGHVVEDRKHLIVSAGLGYSGLPLRIGTRPEIVLLEMGAPVG